MACLRLLERAGELLPFELLMRGFWALHRYDAAVAEGSFLAVRELAVEDEPAAQLGLAYVRFFAGRFDEAAGLFEPLRDRIPSARVMAEAAAAQAAGRLPEEVRMPPLPEVPAPIVEVLQTRLLEGAAAAMARAEAALGQPDGGGALRLPLLRLRLECALDAQRTGVVEALEEALAEFADDGPLWHLLGVAVRLAGDVARSAEAFGHATRAAPLGARAWAALGASLLELDRPADGERCYATATFLDGTLPSAWADLGQAQFLREAFAEAIGSFSRAIALGTDDFTTRFNRGLAALRSGDLDAALADFEQLEARGEAHPRLKDVRDLIALLRRPAGDQYVIGDDL
jgi:tetratricopeptide (TPR) repeat protein